MYEYPGGELELFSKAVRWKKYLSELIGQYIRGDVLEVGAGLGSTTLAFMKDEVERWVCLEPDISNIKILNNTLNEIDKIEVRAGTIKDIDSSKRFDVILYIDVLEHIEDDKSEIKLAANLLSKEGRLVVLAPAFQFLFSEWDRALGHYRRYNAEMLKSLTPHNLVFEKCRYIDSIGFLASLINRIILKQKNISNSQIELWDRIMVPLSRVTDILFHQYFGKSVLAVWKAE